MPRPCLFCIYDNCGLRVGPLDDVPAGAKIVFGHYGLSRGFAQKTLRLLEDRPRHGRVGRPVVVTDADGTTRTFGSIYAAAKTLKISRNLIYRNLNIADSSGRRYDIINREPNRARAGAATRCSIDAAYI